MARDFDYIRQLTLKTKREHDFANSIAMSPALASKLRASALGSPREALLRPMLTME
jgi:hypothetical protein